MDIRDSFRGQLIILIFYSAIHREQYEYFYGPVKGNIFKENTMICNFLTLNDID